jgi:hypothetical protein
VVQGHCHHKSLLKFDAENSVLKKLGLDFEVLASGCCGMAGSFGFESDKYGVSIAIGERKLLPRVRQASVSELIMADGFSCREQIAQQTNRQALHLAEVIHIAQQDPDKAGEPYPEDAMVKQRKASRRKARLRALGTVAAIGAAAVIGWKAVRKHS